MEKEDFEQLEKLLGKLSDFLNHRYCIVPEVIHDCYHIAVYNKDGSIKDSEIAATLEIVALKILAKINTDGTK